MAEPKETVRYEQINTLFFLRRQKIETEDKIKEALEGFSEVNLGFLPAKPKSLLEGVSPAELATITTAISFVLKE
jgi:hypothetical protein